MDTNKILDSLNEIDKKDRIQEIYFWDCEPLLGNLDTIFTIFRIYHDVKFKLISNLTFELNDRMKEILDRVDVLATSFDIGINRFSNAKLLNRWYHNSKEILKHKELCVICTITDYATKHCDPDRLIEFFKHVGFSSYLFCNMNLLGLAKINKYFPDKEHYAKFVEKIKKHDEPENRFIERLGMKNHYACLFLKRDGNYVIDTNGEFIGCPSLEDCKIKLSKECLFCKDHAKCGGRAACIPYCLYKIAK